MTFDKQERATIWNALATAAQRFDANAAQFNELAAAEAVRKGADTRTYKTLIDLAAAFEQQAADSRKLLEVFE